MDIVSSLNIGIHAFFSDITVFPLLVSGVIMGLIFGCIPGLTAALGVSLILPLTYMMTPIQGISTLIGIYVGGISGGLYGAVLLNIPGTSASIVTCFDGTPLAKKGRAAEALSMGVFASFVGGTFSMVVLVTIAPMLAKAALIFGPWEYTALGIMGLSVVVSLASKDMTKGLIAAVVGIFLAMAGMDPVMGVTRFTFGIWQLDSGFPTLATLMGFFALGEMLTQVRSMSTGEPQFNPMQKKVSIIPSWTDIAQSKTALWVGSLIGTLIGILPGVGQSTASMIAYSQVKNLSKHPEEFGNGCIEGVAVSESANNAVNGGAMIPMMTLGIPGDLVTSILMGGLVIHGLQPGPLMFRMNADIVGSMFIAYALSNFVMVIVALVLVRVFVRLLKVPAKILYPVILIMCILGTFSVNNRIFDIWVLLGAGTFGYFFTNSGFSLPPLILGYILGPIVESNFRTAIISSGGNLSDLAGRPIALVIFVISVLFIIMPLVSTRRKRMRISRCPE
ncbi:MULTISPECIES: tripartite tricarboxylate transporter permease [Dethiosulfovibrio]|uniref:Tripartite tricarboxylate transporter permease n=2 Tax=Dethiosulfovibrio TaxID=47054 RepID=A0ABS9ENH4_9BACT|nr:MULTISPECIES: tripartite tricarboxylate transporter permease [Dethiosulfovibrio]MCF4113190.1 tripartite tricarboxylate transporter permease [Dethiosulfovibrio russensis]MCF4142254.1 tripartite tricarboxylate transporter permease [Dethiosulfovibrio marinus]MCF4144562.1 tripartite tricarboxylate transporter permease [Dethiosulfovibrio acidaminovorans]